MFASSVPYITYIKFADGCLVYSKFELIYAALFNFLELSCCDHVYIWFYILDEMSFVCYKEKYEHK